MLKSVLKARQHSILHLERIVGKLEATAKLVPSATASKKARNKGKS